MWANDPSPPPLSVPNERHSWPWQLGRGDRARVKGQLGPGAAGVAALLLRVPLSPSGPVSAAADLIYKQTPSSAAEGGVLAPFPLKFSENLFSL